MAEYKKKKITAKTKPRKSSAKRSNDSYEVIEMRDAKNRANIRKSKPTRPKNISFLKIRGFAISAAVFIFVVAVYLITYLLHPVGVLEYFSNSVSAIGTGSYPISLHGGEPLQVNKNSNVYLVLSETNIEVFNNSGKTVLSSQHGFLQPVLKSSDVRFLVYDQGGKDLKLFNNNGTLLSKKYDNEIITANLSKNGTYAVATRADGYQSQIVVTDKNENKIFEWYCADETINSVALSENGKTLILSALKVKNGAFKTKVYVLNYNSAEPIYSFEYDDVVMSIETSGSNKAVLAFGDKLEFINLKNGQKTASTSNYKINLFKRFGSYILTCSSLAANKNEIEVSIYKFDGRLISSFKFRAEIEDASYYRGKFYILSDSSLYQLSDEGKILMSSECSFDTKKIIPSSSDSVIGISYSKINKYQFK